MSKTPSTSRGYLVLLLALGLSPMLWAATQTTYKWLDDNGNVTYGDHPPKGVKAEEIRISTGTSSSSDSNSTFDAAAAGDDGAPQKKASQTSGKVEVSKEEAASLCEQARNNLEVLENHALIRQTDENGEVRILDEGEKQEQIDTARQIASDYCK